MIRTARTLALIATLALVLGGRASGAIDNGSARRAAIEEVR